MVGKVAAEWVAAWVLVVKGGTAVPVAAAAPAGALAALHRRDVGPGSFSDDYTGYDAVLFINLTNQPVGSPAMALGQLTTNVPLRVQGYTRSPLFGGGGPQVLDSLPGNAIYMTLVPSAVTQAVARAWTMNGPRTVTTTSFTNGASIYILKAPESVVAMGRIAVSNIPVAVTGVTAQVYVMQSSGSLTVPSRQPLGTFTTDASGVYTGFVGTSAAPCFIRAVINQE